MANWADLGLETRFLCPDWGWQTFHWPAPNSQSGCLEPWAKRIQKPSLCFVGKGTGID